MTRQVSILSMPSTLDALNVVGDGVTDDTDALNTYLSGLSSAGGAKVVVPHGVFHYLGGGSGGSTNLNIPQNVELIGDCNPFSGWDTVATNPLTSGSGFNIFHTRTIQMSSASSLSSLKIFRSGLLAAPTQAQVITAAALWNGETSVGITLPANKNGISLKDLFIVGFQRGITIAVGDFSLDTIYIDCDIGVEINGGGDNYYLNKVRVEPFYGINTAILDTNYANWARTGAGFDLSNNPTGGSFRDCFVFCHLVGFYLHAIGVTNFDFCTYETQVTPGGVLAGTGATGFKYSNSGGGGTNAAVRFNNCTSSGDICFDISGGGDCVINSASTASYGNGHAGTCHYKLRTGTWGNINTPSMNFAGNAPGVVVDSGSLTWAINSPMLFNGSPTSWIIIAGGAGPTIVNNPDISLITTGTKDAFNQGATVVASGQPTALIYSTPGDVSTSSTTGVMAGTANYFTPKRTGRVRILINGVFSGSGGSTAAVVYPRYGTGTAPTAGAALTGTVAGKEQKSQVAASGFDCFTCIGYATGLTLGTQYWTDYEIQTVTGGTASYTVVTVLVEEI